MWAYRNPVKIIFGSNSFGRLPELLAGRTYALVTYGEPFFRGLSGRLVDLAGPPVLAIDDVAPNPGFALLADQTGRFGRLRTSPEVIVALGGGSAIDSAKVFAAANSDFATVRHFLENGTGCERLGAVPIIAVPTTAGTGSEVTCWATVWDSPAGVKHSLSLPGLYPEWALVDPELTLTKPRHLTVATGLDALSHALESLWNKNANPVSSACSVSAAKEILQALPRLVEDLENSELRSRMACAALLAGLAFSNTKSAIAHSLSYPITLRHDVPHGIACSFSLPMVMRSVAKIGGTCGKGLREIFETDPLIAADRLAGFLRELGISTDPAAYGITPEAWFDMLDSAFDGERGQNFVGSREALMAAAGIGNAGR